MTANDGTLAVPAHYTKIMLYKRVTRVEVDESHSFNQKFNSNFTTRTRGKFIEKSIKITTSS